MDRLDSRVKEMPICDPAFRLWFWQRVDKTAEEELMKINRVGEKRIHFLKIMSEIIRERSEVYNVKELFQNFVSLVVYPSLMKAIFKLFDIFENLPRLLLKHFRVILVSIFWSLEKISYYFLVLFSILIFSLLIKFVTLLFLSAMKRIYDSKKNKVIPTSKAKNMEAEVSHIPYMYTRHTNSREEEKEAQAPRTSQAFISFKTENPNKKEYKFIEKLGNGAFGICMKALHIQSKKFFAAKVFRKQVYDSKPRMFADVSDFDCYLLFLTL
jgi:hypothetical protein